MKTTGYIWNSVIALAGYYDNKLYPFGTAFLIGNGLAFTSSHILKKPFDKTLNLNHEYAKSNYSLIGFQKIENYETALSWRVESAHYFPIQTDKENDNRPIDLALLKIKPHYPKTPQIEKYRYLNFELNVSPPKVGDQLEK